MVRLSKLIIEPEGSTAPQEIEMQRKKSRQPVWESLAIIELHKKLQGYRLKKKKKEKFHLPTTLLLWIRLRSYLRHKPD